MDASVSVQIEFVGVPRIEGCRAYYIALGHKHLAHAKMLWCFGRQHIFILFLYFRSQLDYWVILYDMPLCFMYYTCRQI